MIDLRMISWAFWALVAATGALCFALCQTSCRTPAATCTAACSRLRAFPGIDGGCPEGQPSPAGETCEAMCERDQAAGPASQLHPDCVADASTLAELAACGVRCRP